MNPSNNTESNTTLHLAFFLSLLIIFIGIIAVGVVTYKKLHPKDFQNQLKTVLGEPLSTLFGVTSAAGTSVTPTPSLKDLTTPVPTLRPTEKVKPLPTFAPTPTPTPSLYQIRNIRRNDSEED